ncbi:MAG: hypothetical protein Q8O87_01930 [bacterium]|nr:hypothetical protein [bacterium]
MSKHARPGNALAELAGPLSDFFEKLGGEESGAWLEAFKRFLRKESPWSEASSTTKSNILIVDYALTLAQMIQAGRYDWVHPDIDEDNFPLNLPPGFPTRGQIIPELIHFNRLISSDKAIAEIKRRGPRPATIWELLAFGEHNPDPQRQFSIIALGSVWRRRNGGGFWVVPSFVSHAGRRELRLRSFNCAFSDRCRFLAVRDTA